jgi:hypothetical protein
MQGFGQGQCSHFWVVVEGRLILRVNTERAEENQAA